jgi:hypothetical protein
MRFNILSFTNVVMACLSNVLTSGSPVANPKFRPDYSVLKKTFFSILHIL